MACGKSIPGRVLPAAAFHGRNSYIKHITENFPGLDLNAVDDNGRSALLRATEAGHSEIVKHLVEKGANLTCKDR